MAAADSFGIDGRAGVSEYMIATKGACLGSCEASEASWLLLSPPISDLSCLRLMLFGGPLNS